MTAEYDEPEVIDFTSAVIMIAGQSALAHGQAIGEVFDLTLWSTERHSPVIRLAVPGAVTSISVGARRFEGRVVIADPQDLVIQVEAEER